MIWDAHRIKGTCKMYGKPCTDEHIAADVRYMNRRGFLLPGHSGELFWSSGGERAGSVNYFVSFDRVHFKYRIRRNNGPWTHVSADALLTSTPCHFGGQRPWWHCPRCHRRVALLYLLESVACRRCFDLAYRSERESGIDRAVRRADKIRDRLRWEPGILNGHGFKPKGMHWRTYERLVAEHDLYANGAVRAMVSRPHRRAR